jgi:Domain of unknown function (DUF6265)
MMPIVRAASVLAALVLGACAAPQSGPEPGPQPAAERRAPDAPDATRERNAPPAAPAVAAGNANPAQASTADAGPVGSFAWLAGCWQGSVNQREFREQWLPLRGGLMIGAGQSVLRGRMQDYEFLRIEPRPDGVYFTQFGGDLKAISFRLATTTTDDKDTIFTFANTADGFPARLIYRRGVEGWLYETIEGALNGTDRHVIYPLRRIDCESGELIHQ